eukprot:6195081-Pleurochrysis_carterae.AAC.1
MHFIDAQNIYVRVLGEDSSRAEQKQLREHTYLTTAMYWARSYALETRSHAQWRRHRARRRPRCSRARRRGQLRRCSGRPRQPPRRAAQAGRGSDDSAPPKPVRRPGESECKCTRRRRRRAPLPGFATAPALPALGWRAARPAPRCLLPPQSLAAGERLIGVGMRCAPGLADAAQRRARRAPPDLPSALKPLMLRRHNVPAGRGPTSPSCRAAAGTPVPCPPPVGRTPSLVASVATDV